MDRWGRRVSRIPSSSPTRQVRRACSNDAGLSASDVRVATSDILILGGGRACLSAAAALAGHAKVTVLEAEDQIGFHSSGRSATMLHYALGDRVIRNLTLASRGFFEQPPTDFGDVPLGRRIPVLVHAREDEREALDALEAEIASFAKLDPLQRRSAHHPWHVLQG